MFNKIKKYTERNSFKVIYLFVIKTQNKDSYLNLILHIYAQSVVAVNIKKYSYSLNRKMLFYRSDSLEMHVKLVAMLKFSCLMLF